tara:strand:- start:692 stop:862 length:171 start_codon:yes stop_codon:yes gene_type:complete
MPNNSAVPAGLEQYLQDMGILLHTKTDLGLENLQRTNTLQVGYYNDPRDSKGDVSF